jgi:hypothetical protein
MSTFLPTDSAAVYKDVPVSWLKDNLMYSVDGYTLFECGERNTTYCFCEEDHEPIGIDWPRLIEGKRDTQYDRVVESIKVNGFTIPICVYRPFRDKEYHGLGNGHHRMAAAINLGLDTINVYWAALGDYMSVSYTTGTRE